VKHAMDVAKVTVLVIAANETMSSGEVTTRVHVSRCEVYDRMRFWCKMIYLSYCYGSVCDV